MERILVFNDKDSYEFFNISEVCEFLNTTEDKVLYTGKVNKESMINGFWIEFEEDRIVQYYMKNPVKVWNSIRDVADQLLIHEKVISKSLTSHNCMTRLHFRWFSETKGRPIA